MLIDYDNGTYHCSIDGEFNAVLCGIDPFAYALPVWSEGFQLTMHGWTKADVDRAYPESA